MKIFPVRFELTFTAPEAAALSIRPREQTQIRYLPSNPIIPKKLIFLQLIGIKTNGRIDQADCFLSTSRYSSSVRPMTDSVLLAWRYLGSVSYCKPNACCQWVFFRSFMAIDFSLADNPKNSSIRYKAPPINGAHRQRMVTNIPWSKKNGHVVSQIAKTTAVIIKIAGIKNENFRWQDGQTWKLCCSGSMVRVRVS